MSCFDFVNSCERVGIYHDPGRELILKRHDIAPHIVLKVFCDFRVNECEDRALLTAREMAFDFTKRFQRDCFRTRYDPCASAGGGICQMREVGDWDAGAGG